MLFFKYFQARPNHIYVVHLRGIAFKLSSPELLQFISLATSTFPNQCLFPTPFLILLNNVHLGKKSNLAIIATLKQFPQNSKNS